ncbi:hypothetical protein Tco_0535174 [Tanacetum coccineum]
MELNKLYDPSVDLSHGHRCYSGTVSVGSTQGAASVWDIIPMCQQVMSWVEIGGSALVVEVFEMRCNCINERLGGAECLDLALPARRVVIVDIVVDGDGVVMARSLSTSTSGGRDMEV